MYYCPNCNNIFDITKNISREQKGGELDEKLQVLSKNKRILEEIDDKMNDIEAAIKKYEKKSKKK